MTLRCTPTATHGRLLIVESEIGDTRLGGGWSGFAGQKLDIHSEGNNLLPSYPLNNDGSMGRPFIAITGLTVEGRRRATVEGDVSPFTQGDAVLSHFDNPIWKPGGVQDRACSKTRVELRIGLQGHTCRYLEGDHQSAKGPE